MYQGIFFSSSVLGESWAYSVSSLQPVIRFLVDWKIIYFLLYLVTDELICVEFLASN